MTVFARILAGLALVEITIALVGAIDSAFADSIDAFGAPGPDAFGAPGPIAGAGLPILAIGYGAYWLVKRFHRKAD
jgi:hypothetical protein